MVFHIFKSHETIFSPFSFLPSYFRLWIPLSPNCSVCELSLPSLYKAVETWCCLHYNLNPPASSGKESRTASCTHLVPCSNDFMFVTNFELSESKTQKQAKASQASLVPVQCGKKDKQGVTGKRTISIPTQSVTFHTVALSVLGTELPGRRFYFPEGLSNFSKVAQLTSQNWDFETATLNHQSLTARQNACCHPL